MLQLTCDSDEAICLDAPSSSGQKYRLIRRDYLPYPVVFSGNNPIYDVEVWSDLKLVSRIGAKSRITEAIANSALRDEALGLKEYIPPNPMDYYKTTITKIGYLKDQMLFSRWEALTAYFKVWDANRSELNTLLTILHNDERLAIEMVQNVRESTTRDQILIQLDRSLYNYLSSFVTLIEITTALIRKYPDSKLGEKFHTFRSFFEVPENLFIRKLRNYVMHHRLPIAGQSLSFGTEQPFKFTIYADIQELLESEEWSAPIVQFLKNSYPTLDLGRILINHLSRAGDQWVWLLNIRNDLHPLEIFLHDSWVTESNWALSGCQGNERGFNL